MKHKTEWNKHNVVVLIGILKQISIDNTWNKDENIHRI